MSDQPIIPSAMTPQRLALMQQRAKRLEPLAQPQDTAGVTETIQRRGKKVAKNGYFVAARAVGQGSKNKKQTTKFANFDEDGEEFEKVTEFTEIDRILNSPMGSRKASDLLDAYRRRRGI